MHWRRVVIHLTSIVRKKKINKYLFVPLLILLDKATLRERKMEEENELQSLPCNGCAEKGCKCETQIPPILTRALADNSSSELLNYFKTRDREWLDRFVITAFCVAIGFCLLLLPFNRVLMLNEINNATNDYLVRTFHIIEFSVPMVIAFVVVIAIQSLPIYNEEEQTLLEYCISCVQFGAAMLDLLTAVLAAIMIYVDQEDFELSAHYLEYSSLLFFNLLDLALLYKIKKAAWKKAIAFILILINIPGIAAMIALVHYEMEFMAHFVEFSFEITTLLASAIIFVV
jgi:hypothetical protein